MTQAQEHGFSLVSGLAAELSSGDLKLPSLPEAVVRVRNALAQPDFTTEQLSRIITTEPALVGNILTMANSIAFRRSGSETTDLKIAISRIGVGMVQTAATTFALRQLRESSEFQEVEHLLAPEWDRSSRVAAATYLIAQKTRKVKPDEALIVGLLHNIGRIYLFSRATKFPAIFESPEDSEQLMDSFHTGVGKAIIEHWNLPAEAATAVEQQDDIDQSLEAPAICAVLTAGMAIAALTEEPATEEMLALAGRKDFQRLEFSEENILKVVEQRAAIRQELGLGSRQA